MAVNLGLKHWCPLVALFFIISCCNSDQAPGEIVGRALQCFSSNVYGNCQESYRLSMEGTINVPRMATDDYCNGPCLTETNLVLNCIDGILYNFQFYNGASTRDVRYSLRTGCGQGSERGNFNVLERINSRYGDYGYGDYDHGYKLVVPKELLMVILSCIFLLYVF